MKKMLFFAVTVVISSSAFAKASKVQCESTALKAAYYINELGWGKNPSESVRVVSAIRDDMGNEEISVYAPNSEFTYKVSLTQDGNSQACIIHKVTTNAW